MRRDVTADGDDDLIGVVQGDPRGVAAALDAVDKRSQLTGKAEVGRLAPDREELTEGDPGALELDHAARLQRPRTRMRERVHHGPVQLGPTTGDADPTGDND